LYVIVGYPQTPEPVIPLVDWHKLTYLVLTCRKTPINQPINVHEVAQLTDNEVTVERLLLG